MPSFCRLELPWRMYRPIKTLKVFNETLFNLVLKMLYTRDVVLRYYVRFLQIRSYMYTCM